MITGKDQNIRNVAIVGPYSSGKTTLLESLLFVTKAINRKGNINSGNTIGDSSKEARDRKMSVEVSVASANYQDTHFTFLDCPGSIELTQETQNILVGSGAAIVVCEPILEKVLTLAPLFKFLDDWEIPHLVFINKMNRASVNYLEILHALQEVSSRPLVPQQYPIHVDHSCVGYVDLITEQAYQYQSGNVASSIALPEELAVEEKAARTEMLETLADFDDALLEQLIEDIDPSEEHILQDLKQDLSADLIVPVFLGIAEHDFGIRPLLDALIKEAPVPEITAARRGLEVKAEGDAIAQVLKTFYTPQGGKLSLVRVWQGTVVDGMTLNNHRLSGLYDLQGGQQQPLQKAGVGQIVALGRLDGVCTGDTISNGKVKQELPKVEILPPVYALAITPKNRQDEVKLSTAMGKLLEEDPSLYWEQHGDTHEVILWGQGEIHLQISLDRLARKYNLPMQTELPKVAYKETIRQQIKSHGRYKHQSGGHGAFGDVYLEIKPLARGEGYHFHQKIVGGVVPKQYISGVEVGVKEYLAHGPLGFPVVDVDVTLTDGSHHSVDSSDQAFKQAARLAMVEGMPQGKPVLLEPLLALEISAPAEFTSKVLQLVTGRRGQILGYDSLEGWKGWDQTTAYLPQAEMHNFIIELRSLTLGVGFFTWKYDHLQEVPKKLAQNVLATAK